MDTFIKKAGTADVYPIDWSPFTEGDDWIVGSIWKLSDKLNVLNSSHELNSTWAIIDLANVQSGDTYQVCNLIRTQLGREETHEFQILIEGRICESPAGYRGLGLRPLTGWVPAQRWLSLEDPYLAMADCGSAGLMDTLPVVGETGVGFTLHEADVGQGWTGRAILVGQTTEVEYPIQVRSGVVSFVSQGFSEPGHYQVTLELKHPTGGRRRVQRRVYVNDLA